MILGLEMGWRELSPLPNPQQLLLNWNIPFFFLAEITLRAACSEICPLCQVSTEEKGKQVGFDVICDTEDKIIRGGQRQYGLLDGSEDQEV